MKAVVILLIGGIYFWGAWKLWKGFRLTNFSPSLPNRLVLSILWPPLIIVNKSFRQNFQKALRG